MKIGKWCILVCALAVAVPTVPGCHSSTGGVVPVTRQNFGYPGMKMSPAYYAGMAKMRAAMAHPQKPPKYPVDTHILIVPKKK